MWCLQGDGTHHPWVEPDANPAAWEALAVAFELAERTGIEPHL